MRWGGLKHSRQILRNESRLHRFTSHELLIFCLINFSWQRAARSLDNGIISHPVLLTSFCLKLAHHVTEMSELMFDNGAECAASGNVGKETRVFVALSRRLRGMCGKSPNFYDSFEWKKFFL